MTVRRGRSLRAGMVPLLTWSRAILKGVCAGSSESVNKPASTGNPVTRANFGAGGGARAIWPVAVARLGSREEPSTKGF